VIEGFELARGNVVVVTDADGSHDFSKIPEMYKLALENDIVIGSRYIKGGKIIDWPINRRIVSFVANFLARILFPDITDPISGFFAVKKDLVHHAILKPRGYKILLEVLGRSYWGTYTEIPYTFTNRKSGESKLRAGTMIDFLYQLFDIARFPGRSWDEVRRMVKFCAVGISGIFVNMIVLAGLHEGFNFPIIGASFIAIEMATISNFILNDTWSFKDINAKKPWLYRMFSFNAVSIGGMIINIAVLGILSMFGLYYLIANLIGIVMGFGWNFIMNRKITWKKD
jgi:dolichol-phosphate mannosyltransferase